LTIIIVYIYLSLLIKEIRINSFLGGLTDSLEHIFETALRDTPVSNVKTISVLLNQMIKVLSAETFNWDLEYEVTVELLNQNSMRQLLFDEMVQSPSDIDIVNLITVDSFMLVINKLIIFWVLFVFLLF